MRDESLWTPSKYAWRNGRWGPATDHGELAPSSRLFASLILDFYSQAVPDFATGHLLDLGSGKQPLYGLYATHASSVTAVDWPSSLHASSHLDAWCDVSRRLPFRDESFDTVLSSDVLEHLFDPGTMFREVSRVLRTQGTMLLNTPFMYPVHEAPHDYLRHTRYSLTRHAEDAGLEVVLVYAIGGALDVLMDILGKLGGQIPVVGPWIAGMLQELTARFGNTAAGQRIRAVTAPYFPLGHALVARKC